MDALPKATILPKSAKVCSRGPALHNERTGGGSVHEDEVQRQRDDHNERTGDVSR